MAALKPWYQVVTPREDLRENRPLDASEFAVHLDHIREKRSHEDYYEPDRFFDRTYLTRSLLDLASQVVRRLSGIKVETSAVFNMATQFGGGKTHSLTALYHLARGGEEAKNWKGIRSILTKAQVEEVPKADVAVFVGTEFDVLDGRGGKGEPHRRTPWGEIAWQLGGKKAFDVVAKHDEKGIAPAGDVIRKMLPARPVLILIDELLNYVSRSRKTGLSGQFYDFVQNLSEESRARDNMVLCVSIPASELEMNPEDQRDYDSYKKMLDRLGKAISMASDTEVTEIIRRRLFEWHGIPKEGNQAVAAYAEWAQQHAAELSNLGGQDTVEVFRACYPFHPSMISVFERKWQSLPRFQRTRGILRLFALWIARQYQEEHRKASREPLITLGSAPLEDQVFRDAVFEQLGSDQLSTPVTTDIAGRKDAHSIRLDREATDSIKQSRLHQKVSTVIFFECNGGQSQSKADASVPEIRAALGSPDLNLAEIETVLEGLSSTCYYLTWDRNRYRFGLRPNLNQMLVTRRGAVSARDIDDQVRKTIIDVFKNGQKALERRYFPARSNDIPDRPQLTLAVMSPDYLAKETNTKALMKKMVRESGSSGRTFKSGLIFVAPDSETLMTEAARTLLAWEDIQDDVDSVAQLEESQKRNLTRSLGRARSDLKEAIWRVHRHVFLLAKDNSLKEIDLGQVTSSMASNYVDLLVNQLIRDDEITQSVGVNRLIRVWPPALTEWSTKDVRDAFFASPALPRLLEPDSIKRTIADGVSAKSLGYARRESDGRLFLEKFGDSMSELEVEIDEDVFILKADDAQKLVEPPRLDRLLIQPGQAEVKPGERVTFSATGLDQYGQNYPVPDVKWIASDGEIDKKGLLIAADNSGIYTITAQVDDILESTQLRVIEEVPGGGGGDEGDDGGKEGVTIRWQGDVPPQKWMNFYTKVLTRFVTEPGLKLQVSFEAPTEAEQAQNTVDEIKSALRDLGLDEDASTS